MAATKEATAQGDEYRRYAHERSEPRRLRIERTAKVTVRVDATGRGSTDIDGIDVSNICYGVELFTQVGQPTTISVRLRGLPAEIEALGVVEITDDGLAVRA